jgi:hypothetical protein
MSDFPEKLPHGDLTEVCVDVFFVKGQTRPNFGGNPLQFSRSMTIVREGSDLHVFNTLRLDENGLAALDALGTVKTVTKVGSFHGRDDAFYLDRYGAAFWAPEGTPHERGLVTGKILDPAKAGPVSGSSVFLFKTAAHPEAIVRIAHSGGCLITCDSVQNMIEPDEHFDAASAKAMAGMGFFRKANIGPGWLNASKPQRSDFDALLELEFDNLLSAHGDPLLGGAKTAIAASVDLVFPNEA